MPIAIDQSDAAVHEQQIVQTLRLLPPEKVAEVWDFVSFLQNRYATAQVVDVGDSWSEQDILDLTKASLAYAEHSLTHEGHDDAHCGQQFVSAEADAFELEAAQPSSCQAFIRFLAERSLQRRGRSLQAIERDLAANEPRRSHWGPWL